MLCRVLLLSFGLAEGLLQTPLRSAPAPTAFPRSGILAMAEQQRTRRELLASAITAGSSLSVLSGLPAAVFAESTLITRQQAYTRYVPRIERGRDYWATGLKKLIIAQDWKSISAAVDKKGSIDRIFGPMGLFASSFSSKTISDKTLAMNTAVDELREAADSLAIAAAGKTSGGFLGFGEKKLDESQRAQLAKAAYAKGISAIDKFIMIGNDGLGMQFAPLDTIQ